MVVTTEYKKYKQVTLGVPTITCDAVEAYKTYRSVNHYLKDFKMLLQWSQ